MKTSVLICTYQRQCQLQLLLQDLAAQSLQADEIVVVDNDPGGSAREVVEDFAKQVSFAVHYDIQPKQGISLTRNRTVELSSGDWLGFLDDDERVVPNWLQLMTECARRFEADGVLAPVVCQVPADAPGWIRQGEFFDLPRYPTGTVVPRSRLYIGNALLRGSLVRAEDGPFREQWSLTGGEDGDMMMRMESRGARIVWCDEAAATEPVASSRLDLRYLLLRSYTGGQVHAMHWRSGHHGARRWYSTPVFALRASAFLATAAVLTMVRLPAGKAVWANWLRTAYANAGKLSGLWGGAYALYGSSAATKPSAQQGDVL